MAKRQIFYSFHYDNDVMRVQQIRNIGVIEGNVPVSVNQWEEVKKGGDTGIKKWIDENLKNKSCVIVLIGEDTANRKWVKYEIEKAWEMGKGVVGIYIHNINCPRNGKGTKGVNPFDKVSIDDEKLSAIINVYNPDSADAYNNIADNIEDWIEEAIEIRNGY